PGDTYDNASEMHKDLTQLAVETIFQRGPLGLMNGDRLAIICDDYGLRFLTQFIKNDAEDFARDQIQQTVEIEQIKLGKGLPTAIPTQVTGTITRKGIFNGEPFVETRSLDIILFWTANTSIATNKAFPSVIHKVAKLEMPIISRS
ncbi:MAG: hypothetical protein ABL974_23705, partial [Prosthecobacter sp.]